MVGASGTAEQTRHTILLTGVLSVGDWLKYSFLWPVRMIDWCLICHFLTYESLSWARYFSGQLNETCYVEAEGSFFQSGCQSGDSWFYSPTN